MGEKHEKKKCSFGAFLDIVDEMQKACEKPVSGKKEGEIRDRNCLYCAKKTGSDAIICPRCRKELPHSD